MFQKLFDLCLFTLQKCYKHVLNAPNFFFKTLCNVPLSCRFTLQILPKYTRFMYLIAKVKTVSTCPQTSIFFTYLLTYLLSYVLGMLFTHVHRISMYVIVELLSLSLSVHEHSLKM